LNGFLGSVFDIVIMLQSFRCYKLIYTYK